MASQFTSPFTGFSEDSNAVVRLPSAFFTQLLPQINDLSQLRLLLYMFWHTEQQPGNVRYFRYTDFTSDPSLMEMMADEPGLRSALTGLVDQHAVLEAELDWMDEVYFFINTPQGQAAVRAIQNGTWQDFSQGRQAINLVDEGPNIFELYEKNIGIITPMMAEILKEDEATYPASWIREAIQIAVTRNVRTWKYVQAILKRWQKEGFGNEQNRQNDPQDPESYRKSWLKR
ncbi:MAG: DnaD domain protein [Brevefilum sp.]|nr:DnaD domain protein [Brevefilum sp.]